MILNKYASARYILFKDISLYVTQPVLMRLTHIEISLYEQTGPLLPF